MNLLDYLSIFLREEYLIHWKCIYFHEKFEQDYYTVVLFDDSLVDIVSREDLLEAIRDDCLPFGFQSEILEPILSDLQ